MNSKSKFVVWMMVLGISSSAMGSLSSKEMTGLLRSFRHQNGGEQAKVLFESQNCAVVADVSYASLRIKILKKYKAVIETSLTPRTASLLAQYTLGDIQKLEYKTDSFGVLVLQVNSRGALKAVSIDERGDSYSCGDLKFKGETLDFN